MSMKFNVRIAGHVLQMRCEHRENLLFMKDYLTEEAEETVIWPKTDYLAHILADYENFCQKTGRLIPKPDEAELENIGLRNLTAEYLLQCGILLCHASALIMDGKCHLFMGKSGAGKSTHVSLWKEYFGERVWILNDDKPFIEPVSPGLILVYGSPWRGKHEIGVNASAPLASVTFVTKADHDEMVKLSTQDAFQSLYKHGYRSDKGMSKALAIEKEMLTQVPFFELYCTLSQEAVQTAYNGIYNISGKADA